MKLLRSFLRVLLVIALLLAAVALIILGPLRARSTDLARRYLEQALAAALHAPVSIAALRVSFVPPRIDADGVVLGEDGALARSAHVTIRLRARLSLAQLRPVADAVVEDVFVDVPRWVDQLESPEPEPPTPVPSFLLRQVRVNRAQVRLSPDSPPLAVEADVLVGELEADLSGQLRFAVDAERTVLGRGGDRLTLQRVRGRGGETLQGWRLTEVELIGDGVQLSSSPAEGDRLPIRGRVRLPQLAFASELFTRLSGEAEVDAALIGPLDEPTAAGDVRVAALAIDGERVGDVDATMRWDPQKLTVSSARLQDGRNEVDLRGELEMQTPFAYQASVRWTAVDAQRLARLPERAVKPFAASGEAELTGALEPLALRAAGGGRFTAAQGGEAIEWQGTGSYRDGAGGGSFEARQATANTLRADFDIAAHGVLNGSFDAGIANPNALSPFFPIEDVPSLTGALTASAKVSGTVDDPRLDGRLEGRDVVLLGIGIDTVGGAFALDRAALQTPGIRADLWQGSVALTGRLALDAAGENDWALDAVDVPGDAVVGVAFALTGTVPPIGRGMLAARLSARGPWQRLQFTASAEMTNFWLTQQWIVRAALEGTGTWPRWQLSGELRNQAAQTLVVRGSGTGIDDVALSARSDGWQLTALQRGEFTETGGTVVLDASVRGPLRALNGRALLQTRDVVVGGRPLGGVDIEAVATRGRWELTSVLLGGAVRVRGTLRPEPGWPVSLEAEWTQADAGPLLAPDSAVHVTSSGTLQATARLAAIEQFDARMRIPDLRIVNGPYELTIAQPALLECRRGTCTLSDVVLRGADTDLRISAVLGSGGVVDVRLKGTGNLRLLELAGGTVVSARGGFTVDAQAQRRAGRWDIGGEMRVEQAGIDVGAPLAITRANGRLTLAGTTVHVAELSGRVGSGTFTVTGDIDLTRGPELAWTVADVGADLLPSLEAEFSGSGNLGGPWERMLLSGEVDVARMLYDRDIELTDFLPRLNRALAEAPRQGTQRIELDLHIVAPGELYVENNIARIEARADLRVRGRIDRPIVEGRIEALDGTVTFRDRVFELQGGTVDFRPELGIGTAALNITAESTIDTPDATYTVDVRITGTTRDPRVTMTSDDPSLSPTDIGTLIAVGKTTAQLREGGGGFSMYDALAAGAGRLAQPITEGTKQLLPIDRISFESTYSRTSGSFEPQLKLGKDLTDNLAVSIGQTFGVESRTTAGADYRLTPRVFIPLTWESQTSTQEGAFGAGVKVRYEFWRITPYTLIRGLR
jgi:hypothetical protein